MPDTTGKTAIVTGANGGIGRSVARNLAAAGARVVLAVRSTENGNEAAAGMRGATEVYGLDLASSDSVQAFAARWHGPIDLLINNAGVWAPSLTRTADGFESDFGTNHLGHFALTTLLLEHITGRVVTVASQVERLARLDLEDPNWERRPFESRRAYNDSKLANLVFTAELQRRRAAVLETAVLPRHLPSRRIRRREAVTRDPPLAVTVLPENEELLIGLGGGLTGRSVAGCAGGIRPHISPVRRHHDELGDRKLDVELQLTKNGVVGLTHGLLADG
jgi:NAD(P)-dependent dehydrogenase (short-subunit alcohol dehydrogenase family)